MENMESLLSVSDLTVDCNSHMVMRNREAVFLTAKEYAVLEYLIRNAGEILSKEQIGETVWQQDYEGDTNIVAVYINYLREKIDSGHEKKLIHTVRGSGYVLREE